MTILQILPADKWWAVYRDENREYVKTPLVCLALCQEDDGSTRIVPMDKDDTGEIRPCRDIDSFDSIAHEIEFEDDSETNPPV